MLWVFSPYLYVIYVTDVFSLNAGSPCMKVYIFK